MPINTKNIEEDLLKELKMIENELSTVARKNPQNPEDWEPTPARDGEDETDPNTVADKIESFEENIGITRELEIRLAEVKSALEKIEKGTYGKCEKCGKDIESDRLQANPAAATCKAHMA